MIGTVSNVIDAKKYGFVTGDDGKEYFFHVSDMETDWNELVCRFGEVGGGKIQVGFEATKTPKGPRANNVGMIEG